MGYPQGPYEKHDRLPVPERPQWGPAREIDFTTGRYVIKANGSFSHMPPVAQRVVILVLNNEVNPPFNTLVSRNQWVQDVTNILRPLERESPPSIRIEGVEAIPTEPGGVEKIVRFRDLSDQSNPIVEVQIP